MSLNLNEARQLAKLADRANREEALATAAFLIMTHLIRADELRHEMLELASQAAYDELYRLYERTSDASDL